MRRYILTAREREILTSYLEKGTRLDGYRELRHQLRGLDLEAIDQDRALITRFLEASAT